MLSGGQTGTNASRAFANCSSSQRFIRNATSARFHFHQAARRGSHYCGLGRSSKTPEHNVPFARPVILLKIPNRTFIANLWTAVSRFVISKLGAKVVDKTVDKAADKTQEMVETASEEVVKRVPIVKEIPVLKRVVRDDEKQGCNGKKDPVERVAEALDEAARKIREEAKS